MGKVGVAACKIELHLPNPQKIANSPTAGILITELAKKATEVVIEVTKIENAASGKHCLAISSSDLFGYCSRFILNLSTTTKMSIRKNGALLSRIYGIEANINCNCLTLTVCTKGEYNE